MSTLKIDLSTRVLRDDMQVYLIHPGARYVFYDDILEQSVIPVDIPFLAIPDGQGLPTTGDIVPMIERARQMRKWARRPKSDLDTPRPPMDLDYYRVGLDSDDTAQGARTKLWRNAQKILWSIPEGSLAVFPSQRVIGEAILAEVGGNIEQRTTVSGRDHYHGMEFLARRIHNLKTIPMLSLPGSVIASARSTSTIEQIEGHEEDQILRLYYGDYQRNSDFVAGVIANTDDFDSLIVGQMIDLHVAIDHFIRTGRAVAPGRALYEIGDAVAPNLHATINSPDGRASLESRGVATFAVKLLLIVAASDVALTSAGDLLAQAEVVVENSAQQDIDTTMIEASKDALVNFFATSGAVNSTEYLQGLQDGLLRNQTSPTGTASIEP